MYEEIITKDDLLIRIAKHLIVNASFLDNLGLFHGKMGVVLALAILGRKTGDILYEKCAGDLMDELFEDLSEDTPVDFEDGLSGIGWGILWLLNHDYMEGDPNEVLADIDRKIMECDLRRVQDGSFRLGLGGISFYIEARLNGMNGSKAFDRQYFTEWQKVIQANKVHLEKRWPSDFWMNYEKIDDFKFLNRPLGLDNGCAGYIIHVLKESFFL